VKLENSFTIDAPVEKAWEALNSPETVAPCFPGATLTTYEGDSFSGTVKVKLGPISMTYKGKGTYVSRDEAAHEVVIDANGRDSRGNGTASAKVTASLAADGPDRTAVSMLTDMTITGKPAQFGRGVISDVADKIIGQFSACVARKLAPEAEEAAAVPAAATAGSGAATPASASSTASPAVPDDSTTSAPQVPTKNGVAPSTADRGGDSLAVAAGTPPVDPPQTPTGGVRSEVDAIDQLDTAGAPVLKRVAPALGAALLVLLVVLLVRRLRGGGRSQGAS
jgi:carbon monoxide dehydrogenase subunit G